MSTDLVDDDTVLVPAAKNPDTFVPDRAPESFIHYNLRTVSYSALLTLHSCPRRFELNRLIPRGYDPDKDDDANGHLDFGTVVGNGVQELLVSKSMDKAIFRAFLDWKDNLDSERGERSKKTFWHAVEAIKRFTELMNGPLSQYEMVYFEGKPATELGFSIDCGDGFTYRGKLDALLIHKTKREYLPIECKTTGSYTIAEAMYGNSNQGLGYGIVIDRVVHEGITEVSGYDIFYPVYSTFKREWIPFRFPKGNTSRALWLQNTMLDITDIQKYSEIDYFPTRGESCYSFGRECKYYGQCHLDNSILIGNREDIPIKLDKVGEFPLEFSLIELMEAQAGKQK